MQKPTKNIEVYQEQLKKIIQQIADIKPENLDEFVKAFELEFIPKKTFILREGEYSEETRFVIKGIVRIYYVREEKEITNWFISENMFFAAVYAILTGERNYNYYETLEDTICLKLNYRKLEEFYAKNHCMEHFGRKLIENYYSLFMKKSYEVLFLSAEERYHTFVKERGDLLNRIPLRYISSYLGITQETLSRLRAKH